ncbi:hypothetical protein BDB01DRAFT_768959 [Pilobolus umbonatus]|nr:hypothetical protein BDB01DRAFT_768959 [Pilobolus umbonatus]
MSTFPVEIFREILQYIPRECLYNYLTLCKSWYTIILPLLYRGPILNTINRIDQFFMAATAYPECIKACKYVMKLEIPNVSLILSPENYPAHYKLDGYYFVDDEIKFEEVLLNCPNLEHLGLLGNIAAIQFLRNIRLNILQKIKKIELNHLDLGLTEEYIECLVRYSSTLTDIYLGDHHCRFIDNHSSIQSYLSHFTCLTTLSITIPFVHKLKDNPLSTILNMHPRLKKLEYRDYSDHVVEPDITVIHPSMIHTTLFFHSFHLHDALYIKNSFICLKILHLTVDNKLYDETLLLNALMEIKSLNNLFLNTSVNNNEQLKNMLSTFWSKSGKLSATQKSQANTANIIRRRTSNDKIWICLTFNNEAKDISVMESKITFPFRAEISYQSYLGGFGIHLNNLKIGYFKIDLNIINSSCPKLSTLQLQSVEFTHSSTSYSNSNISCLQIHGSQVVGTLFRKIESFFPKLQTLGLFQCRFRQSKSSRVLRLPETGLKELMFDKYMLNSGYITILKECNDVQTRLWSNESHEYPQSRGYFLKSSTLEKIEFVDSESS